MNFESLNLRPELMQAVKELGYETPTPIQERAIPALIAGRDMLGQAQTGTGKTAAFALPLLEKLDFSRRTVHRLPTRPRPGGIRFPLPDGIAARREDRLPGAGVSATIAACARTRSLPFSCHRLQQQSHRAREGFPL